MTRGAYCAAMDTPYQDDDSATMEDADVMRKAEDIQAELDSILKANANIRDPTQDDSTGSLRARPDSSRAPYGRIGAANSEEAPRETPTDSLPLYSLLSSRGSRRAGMRSSGPATPRVSVASRMYGVASDAKLRSESPSTIEARLRLREQEVLELRSKVQELQFARAREAREREAMEKDMRAIVASKDKEIETLSGLCAVQARDAAAASDSVTAAEGVSADVGSLLKRVRELEADRQEQDALLQELRRETCGRDEGARDHVQRITRMCKEETRRMARALQEREAEIRLLREEAKTRSDALGSQIDRLRTDCSRKDAEVGSLKRALGGLEIRDGAADTRLSRAMQQREDTILQLRSELKVSREELRVQRDTSAAEVRALKSHVDGLTSRLRAAERRGAQSVEALRTESSAQVMRVINVKGQEFKEAQARWAGERRKLEELTLKLKMDLGHATQRTAQLLADERAKWAGEVSRAKALAEEEVKRLRGDNQRVLDQLRAKFVQERERERQTHGDFVRRLKEHQRHSDTNAAERLHKIHKSYVTQLAQVNRLLGQESGKLAEARAEAMRLATSLEAEKRTAAQYANLAGELEGAERKARAECESKLKAMEGNIQTNKALNDRKVEMLNQKIEDLESARTRVETSHQIELASGELEAKELKQRILKQTGDIGHLETEVERLQEELLRLRGENKAKDREVELLSSRHGKLLNQTQKYRGEMKKLETMVYGKGTGVRPRSSRITKPARNLRLRSGGKPRKT